MILLGLILAIITIWSIVLFNHYEASKKNEDRYKGIYSNKEWYD